MYFAVYGKFASSSGGAQDDNICDSLTNVQHLNTRRYLCAEGYFDRLATLLFDT